MYSKILQELTHVSPVVPQDCLLYCPHPNTYGLECHLDFYVIISTKKLHIVEYSHTNPCPWRPLESPQMCITSSPSGVRMLKSTRVNAFPIKPDSVRIKAEVEIALSSVMDFSLYDCRTSVRRGKRALLFDSDWLAWKSEILFLDWRRMYLLLNSSVL